MVRLPEVQDRIGINYDISEIDIITDGTNRLTVDDNNVVVATGVGFYASGAFNAAGGLTGSLVSPSGSVDRINCQVLSASQGVMVTGSVKASTSIAAGTTVSVGTILSCQVVSASQDVNAVGNLIGLTASVGCVSSTGDINAAGGFADSFNFYKSNLIAGERCAMTASVILSSSNFYKVYTKVPMVRSGSILGIALYSEFGNITAGGVSASVMIDGANAIANNTTASLYCPPGSSFVTTFSKDVYRFSGSQTIGVSLTASTDCAFSTTPTSGSWCCTVLAEI